MKCPVCGKEDYNTWGKVNQYSILRCKDCGLGVTWPFPSEEEMAKVNQETYQVEERIHIYLTKQLFFETRYRQYASRIKNFVTTGRLLDIGCNIGLFLKVAREEGFSPTGIEINKRCAYFGREKYNVEIFSDYLENIKFASDSFEVITLFDVLEHIPNLSEFIEEVRRIIKPGGLVLVQSPNLNSLMAKLNKSNWFWLCPPDHLFHFSPGNLSTLLEDHGFIIMKTNTWEPPEEFYNNLLASYNPQSSINKIIFKLLMKSRIVDILIRLIKGVWWHYQKGGLIEMYAIKREEAE